MFAPDWKENAENVKDYISDSSFFKCRNVEEICGFLDAKPLKAIEFDIFFKSILEKHDRNSLLDLLRHVNIEYTNNISEILNNLNTLFNLLNIPFIMKMSVSIGSIISNTITNTILNELQALKTSQNTITNSILNEIRSMKVSQNTILDDLKKTQNTKFEEMKKTQQMNYDDIKRTQNTKFEEVKYKIDDVSKNVKLQIRQENFNKMKMIPKNSSNYDKIYSIFEKIAEEDDYISMKLAIESKYHDVTAKKRDRLGSLFLTRDIITHGADMNNFKLVKMLTEFGVDPSINGSSLESALWLFCRRDNLEALKYFCELPGMNVNSPSHNNRSLIYVASSGDYYDICEYLLSLDGVDVNMRTNEGETALSVAKSDRVRSLLKSHGAK